LKKSKKMRKCDKIVRFGRKGVFWYYILVKKMMKQVKIGKKDFLYLLNLVKIS
jgi:hypothetical protein